ncbi:hypothetical protein OESDEN_00249, partial [Oesophagostomum dentatum]
LKSCQLSGSDDVQTYACATPSTSSTDHKSYVDETPTLSAPRRRSDRIRLVVAYPRADDPEHMMLLADEPGPSGEIRSGFAGIPGLVPLPSSSSMQPDLREELDPFKIRALLDNMKQMVAADTAETSGSSRSASCGRTFRSGSARSLSTIAVQPFEVAQGTTKRRSILHSLFSSEKSSKK